MAGVDNNGWSKYEKLVMDKLDEHDDRFGNVEEKLTQIQVDIATLKVKAGVWGGVAGLIPAVKDNPKNRGTPFYKKNYSNTLKLKAN